MKTTGESCGTVNRRPAVLIDFDDTAAEQNVGQLVLRQFGDPSWQEVRQRFLAGDMNLSQYQEITFRQIAADQPTMQHYVMQHANLRPYFSELWGYCQTRDIPMAIVSHGLDFYIAPLLEKEGCSQVPVYSVNTKVTTDGMTFEYRYARPGQEREGNSKGLVVDRYRQQGHYVFYIGDGLLDFEAAARADLLFAHRTLAEECSRLNVPFRPFTDFEDVLLATQEYYQDERQAGRSSDGSLGASGTSVGPKEGSP